MNEIKTHSEAEITEQRRREQRADEILGSAPFQGLKVFGYLDDNEGSEKGPEFVVKIEGADGKLLHEFRDAESFMRPKEEAAKHVAFTPESFNAAMARGTSDPNRNTLHRFMFALRCLKQLAREFGAKEALTHMATPEVLVVDYLTMRTRQMELEQEIFVGAKVTKEEQ